MKASDVMIHNVITVGPEASVEDVAKILIEKRVSALPVIDGEGRLVGIISESDLMRRPEAGTQKRRSRWLEFIMSREQLASEFARTHAHKVADIMTRHVITAKPDTPLRDIADIFEKQRIKRVPIVDQGKIVGIVSRANLVQAFASAKRPEPAEARGPDESIRQTILAHLKNESWARPWLINVIVQAGVVDLWGVVDTDVEKRAVRIAAEEVTGVRAVNDHLIVHAYQTGI